MKSAQGKHMKPMDVYSLGWTLAQCLTSQLRPRLKLFYNFIDNYRIDFKRGDIPTNIEREVFPTLSDNLGSLLRRITSSNPDSRPKIGQVLKCKWLQ